MTTNSRRFFLQRLLASSVTIPFLYSSVTSGKTSVLTANQQGPTLRVALMGLGDYASRVAEAMQSCKRAKITGLISGTPAKLQQWGEKYQVPEDSRYSYENFDSIRDNSNIDVVYVITPNALHHEHTIRAAKAGKHVICEKPMALDVKEGQEMIDACAQAGVKLLVGYRMHFEPNTLEIIRMRDK